MDILLSIYLISAIFVVINIVLVKNFGTRIGWLEPENLFPKRDLVLVSLLPGINSFLVVVMFVDLIFKIHELFK